MIAKAFFVNDKNDYWYEHHESRGS